MQNKFFEIIPSGTNLQFIAKRWRFIALSIIAICLGLFAMGMRYVSTGSVLNFGIDFAGGSQVQLAFNPEAKVAIEDVRIALEDLGYEGSSAVTVPDKDDEILVRVKEVVSIDDATQAACEQAAATVGDAKLIAFSHPEGGSKIFLRYDTKPNYREVERVLAAAGCVGTADKGTIAKEGEAAVDVALIGIGAKIKDELDARFGAGTIDHIVRAETVGSKVGSQLKTDGVKAMLYAMAFIFLYVMIRFDLRFAPGAIVALCHDAFLMVAAFAITGKEFNLQTVAAVLTIIGYSINDTIVVFDRIRERVAMHREESIEEASNRSINETLSRTLLTSLTTIIVVLAIYLMGTGPIKEFAFALLVGLVVGTYSSVYMATPIFLWVNRRFYGGTGHLRALERAEREGTGTLLEGEKEAAEEAAGVALEAPGESEVDGEGEDGPKKATRRRRRRRPESE